MDLVEIIDDFLTDDELDVVSGIEDHLFPWFSQDHTDFEGDGNPQFTHMFYQNNGMIKSDFIGLVNPLIVKVRPFALLKIKANLNLNSSKESNFHIDYGSVEHIVPEEIKTVAKTSIFYLNDNLGGTEFEDGTFVQTKRNRMVTFASGVKHRSVKHTIEGQRRFVVNLNYIPFLREAQNG